MTTHAPRRSLGRRIVRVAATTTMTLAILVSLAWLALGPLGYSRYVITGGSMSGTFEKGSIAFEQEVPVSQLNVGDVITYLPPADSRVSNLVTHRIAEIRSVTGQPTTYRTKGDANAAVDPWTFALDQSTQPVVRFTVPVVGYAFVALADRTTRMLVIGIPAGLIAIGSLVELVRAYRDPSGKPAGPRGERPGVGAPGR